MRKVLEERIKEVFSKQNLKNYSASENLPLREISSSDKLRVYLTPSLTAKEEEVRVEKYIWSGGRQNTYAISIGKEPYAASIRKEKIGEGESEQSFTLEDINSIPGIIPTYGLVRTAYEGEEFYFGTICILIKDQMDLEWFIQGNGYLPERGLINQDYLALVLFYFHQMLRSINGLKEKKIVHKDFKNRNIIIDGENAFLTDFYLMQHENAGTKSRIVGTPIYMSTEALRNEPLDFRADLYSWAVCLAEAVGYLDLSRYDHLTTRLHPPIVLKDICDEDYLPLENDKKLRHLPGELIPPITDILKNGLSPSKEERDLNLILGIFEESSISDYILLAQTEEKKKSSLLNNWRRSLRNILKGRILRRRN